MEVQAEKAQQTPQEEQQNNGAQKSTASGQQLRILSRFMIKEKLGSGSFGHIYKALDQDRNELIALKIESHAHSNNLTLNREAKILRDIEGENGFPTIYYYSKEENYSMLAMSLLGNNLEKLFKSCDRKFTLKTVLMLADQMIRRVEYIHTKGYIHRDIKPENFVMGPQKDPKTLFMIDFGLSKMFRDHNGKHSSYKEGRGLVGTARYASINTHLGIEQSRRDDLESIGYLLIYFLKGSLPWQNIRSQSKAEKYKQIADSKVNTPIEELCKDIPKEFAAYMNYVKNLAFTDQPDYKFLKKLLRQLLVESGLRFDFDYDWYKIPDKGVVEFINAREHKTPKNDVEDLQTKQEKKDFEIYDEIKLKALEFNIEFRERNKNMGFAPPQHLIKLKTGHEDSNSPVCMQKKISVSPVRKSQPKAVAGGMFGKLNPKMETDTALQPQPKAVAGGMFGKLNPKMETDTALQRPNQEFKQNKSLFAAVTMNYTKGSVTDSPLLPRKGKKVRNMMPSKPEFAIINNVLGINQGDNSSPKMSVNKGSSCEVPEENYDCDDPDENVMAEKPINGRPKNFAVKRLEELKSTDFIPMARNSKAAHW